jgi:1-acyl-sn-glycerol-3-phosphate acyltransferase
MHHLRVLRRTLLLTAHVLLGLFLTVLLPARRSNGTRRTNPYVTSWWHNRTADILGLEITVSGYYPRTPALIVSNHVSWLDVVVLGGLTPTTFLSKQEVRDWPVVGWLAARAGTLFIRRGDGEAGLIKEKIAGQLRGDGLLTLFPEGTTTDGTEVRPFFSRLFAAAIDARCDVVPVALRYHVDGQHDPLAPYTGEQSLGDNLLGLMRRQRSHVHVSFGDPIGLEGKSRRDIAKSARDAVIKALQSPRPLTGIDRVQTG